MDSTERSAATASGRERLRRAAEDGERLYRKRMHDEPTIADDNRIDGILTLDLTDALGYVDRLHAQLEDSEQAVERAARALQEIAFTTTDPHAVALDALHSIGYMAMRKNEDGEE